MFFFYLFMAGFSGSASFHGFYSGNTKSGVLWGLATFIWVINAIYHRSWEKRQ